MTNGARRLIALMPLALGVTMGCAPLGPYQGARPVPGAITHFAGGGPNESGHALTRPWPITGTNPETHHLGTLQIREDADSAVVIVYGDNRPGFRTRSQSLGWAQIRDFEATRPVTWIPALAGVPLFLVQLFVPAMDGPQDLVTALGSHRPNGGGEAQVLRALEEQLSADLVVNAGDLVYDGRRGKLWDDFVRKHAALRKKVTFIAAPGNHERIHAPSAEEAWNTTVGPPAHPQRYWYTLDLPGQLARFVILDSNVLADAKGAYPDDIEGEISREQLGWLDGALASPARHHFVVLHHPLFSAGSHATDWGTSPDDPAWQRRRRLEETLARRGVTAVFAGHEHLYNRVFIRSSGGAGYWHVTTGGAGSPLYPLREKTRAASLARMLPAGLEADPATVHTEVAYHFCRLVLMAGTSDARMDVYRVYAGGGYRIMDRVILRAHPS